MVTGYYKRGHVIMKRGPIIRRYLRTWFLIDLISSFPYSWIFHDSKIEYWPADDFDSANSVPVDPGAYINNLISGISSLRLLSISDHSLLNPRRLNALPQAFTATSATDFSLPQLLRLLKLIRFIRIVKLFQIFKLRKFVYRVSFRYPKAVLI